MSQENDLKQTELPGFQSSPGDFHAKICQQRENRKALLRQADQDYGGRSTDLLAKYDPDTQSLRTSQNCLMAQILNQGSGLAEYSETWPRGGMMRNGNVYRRALLTHPMYVTGCGLYPTPQASDNRKCLSAFHSLRNPKFLPELGRKDQWINPEFSEWLMNFPINWTDLKD